MRIKPIVISHNQPESVDALFEQLTEAFESVEVWDTHSDPDKVPKHLTIADDNIYWEGVWNKAMQRFGDYDVLWILGGDVSLLQSSSEYKKAIEEAMPFGCWSPCIEGRAHPFMKREHYGHGQPMTVKNIEGMALAVSTELIREIGGKFELKTKIGFGQDYWLCYKSRKSGMRNIIDGSVAVSHPPGIGYDEQAAHDAFDEAFSVRYGQDFRKTIFEYDQRYEGNLVKEKQETNDMLTVITVENGWGVDEIEEIMKQVSGIRLIVMQKGVSNFDVKNATVLPYTTDLDDLISQADLALFARVGPANEREYHKVVEAGVPSVVHHYYHQGKIKHEENGFVYGHVSWAVSWLKTLVENQSLRQKISAAWVKSDAEKAETEKPEPPSEPEVPESFEQAMKDVDEGNLVPLDVALYSDPLEEGEVLVSFITPTYRRKTEIIRRSYDCLKLQTVNNWEQLICSDGSKEDHAAALVREIGDERVQYHHLNSKKDGDFGNRCRAEMLSKARGRYVVFFDDDNIILPEFIEKMTMALEQAEADFAVCDVMHFGPLNEPVSGKPPIILKGEPVKLYHVDPLQILVKREAMQSVGWNTERGYVADGVSLEALGDRYTHVKVNEVLGVHV